MNKFLTLRKATRRQAKIKLSISGPSGSGKTYSSLLMAYGLTGDWTKIALIDTENGSGDLYSDFGEYNVLTLPDYSPETYIEAIQLCESEGMECVIIDSITHEWKHCLEAVDNIGGNSYTAWKDITPRHDRFVQAITTSKIHVIATTRKKQDYLMEQNDKGKYSIRKVGLKDVQRDGLDYEFTIAFDLNINHTAIASKDRTGIFMNEAGSISPFVITKETGEEIRDWCESGEVNPSFMSKADQIDFIKSKLKNVNTVEDLTMLKDTYPELFSIKEIKDITRAHFYKINENFTRGDLSEKQPIKATAS